MKNHHKMPEVLEHIVDLIFFPEAILILRSFCWLEVLKIRHSFIFRSTELLNILLKMRINSLSHIFQYLIICN